MATQMRLLRRTNVTPADFSPAVIDVRAAHAELKANPDTGRDYGAYTGRVGGPF